MISHKIEKNIHKIEKNAFLPALARRNLWSPIDEISMSQLWDDITFSHIFILILSFLFSLKILNFSIDR